MANDNLLERQADGVRTLKLNRPEALNALDTDLMRGLREAVAAAWRDETVRCLVLTGSGRGFCSGGDTRAMAAAAKERIRNGSADGDKPSGSNFEKRVEWLRRNAETSRILHEMPKPTIAMINGACAGAGLSLAAACDFRIAGVSAKFRSAFTANGLSGDYGGAWLWTRILGSAKARQLYFIDRKRTAEEALAFGLVDELCADDALESRVMELAHQLASLPGAGAAYAKANLNAALQENFAAALDRESQAMLLSREALSTEMKSRS